MKLKYIIPALFAAFATVVGCNEEKDTYLDEVRVSSSYVSISVDGGVSTITVTATEDWAFAKIFKIDTGETDLEGNKIYVQQAAPEWLTLSATQGVAGETEITFSAEEVAGGRAAELQLVCAGRTQHINVIQGSLEAEDSKCNKIIAGPDSKTYRVTGIVKSIANTTYGNWYLEDETGEVYIYGTLDAKGNEKNFTSLGIEVGDKVTVEGPKTTYNGVVELVNVTVIKIVKSLVKVEPSTVNLDKDAADFIVNVLYSGNTYEFSSEADWLSVVGSTTVDDTLRVKIHATENTGSTSREGVINFSSSNGKSTSTVSLTVSQKGAIMEAVVKDVLDAEDDNSLYYRVTGYVSAVNNLEKGRFDITDYSGTIYCYNIAQADGSASTDISSMVARGDIVTIVCYRSSYNGTKQLLGYLESVKKVTKVTIAEFVAAADDDNVLYSITGVVTDGADENAGKKFDVTTYGNFDLVDATGSVYVYGVRTGLNGESGKFSTLGVVEGDKLTIVASKTTYASKNLIQAKNAWYVSHESYN
jgi:hypothetical protein